MRYTGGEMNHGQCRRYLWIPGGMYSTKQEGERRKPDVKNTTKGKNNNGNKWQ